MGLRLSKAELPLYPSITKIYPPIELLTFPPQTQYAVDFEDGKRRLLLKPELLAELKKQNKKYRDYYYIQKKLMRKKFESFNK